VLRVRQLVSALEKRLARRAFGEWPDPLHLRYATIAEVLSMRRHGHVTDEQMQAYARELDVAFGGDFERVRVAAMHAIDQMKSPAKQRAHPDIQGDVPVTAEALALVPSCGLVVEAAERVNRYPQFAPLGSILMAP